jgi:hypothetical protein
VLLFIAVVDSFDARDTMDLRRPVEKPFDALQNF